MLILGSQFLIGANYFTVRQTKKNVVVGVSLAVCGLSWGPHGLPMCKIAPYLAEVVQDQSRVVGGGTRPSVPHTSHVFDS